MNIVRVTICLVVLLLGASLFLLMSGRRILISEDIVRPGENYFVSGFGNVGVSGADSLVCGYFTGRGFVRKVYWHSQNDFLGKSECPFVLVEE